MIAPAIAGLNMNPKNGNRMPAAMGMPNELYPNDQMRFCQIVLLVFFARLIASATFAISPLSKIISGNTYRTKQ